MQAVIDVVKPKNPALDVRVMLSCADSVGTDNDAAAQALSQYPGMTYQATPVARRKSIAAASAQGLSVLECKPKDKKAIAEIEALTNAIFA